MLSQIFVSTFTLVLQYELTTYRVVGMLRITSAQRPWTFYLVASTVRSSGWPALLVLIWDRTSTSHRRVVARGFMKTVTEL